MFTSKQELVGAMGIDPEIAAFFVDRSIPAGNQYWKGRYLYVARGTGYLFIPLFFDLQLRAGVPKEKLLDPQYVSLMERILDLAARYEFGEMDFRAHISQVEELAKPFSVHEWLFISLENYFNQRELNKYGILGTDNPALNRGDALLFLLTSLDVPKIMIEKIVGYWYLLVPSFLLMDDIVDLKEDQARSEETALSHYGFDAKGVQMAIEIVENNFSRMEVINPLLGQFFRNALEKKKQTPYFQTILKD
ncbi:hypothetical protein ACFSQD_18290 [Flavihumibacter stibioxidans]|uniref:Uncharacterized protein n=1 Tax=Flavihumibacter stibioxidans TaxID=1834163 RepID=A0ABR7MDJ2_9BACT|nr:hypothetical protein [Flavihumibacter stibioxidans]MBC6492638.1 hypothetical protein [Flavihumibacter stibioxidans]